ncbi:MAG: DUF4199 domain-containing protein [Pseudomonadota bacterium]
MTPFILRYGSYSGILVIATLLLGALIGSAGAAVGELLGYLFMLVALSMIFIAIKRYRDQELGGVIRFWQGVTLGIGISLVAALAYVVGWEIYLNMTDYAFMDEYAQGVLDEAAAGGASEEALAQLRADTELAKENYARPLYRLSITFLEIFPVGIVVTLISAGLLRNPRLLRAG